MIAAAKNILTQWDEVNKCIKNEGYEPTETIENLPINILWLRINEYCHPEDAGDRR